MKRSGVTEGHSKQIFIVILTLNDNKLAMSLFCSREGDLTERLRQQRVTNGIIHSCT